MNFFEVLKNSLPGLFSGFLVTIEIAFFGLIIASIVGLIFCLMNLSKFKILKYISNIYIYCKRNTFNDTSYVCILWIGASTWIKI